MDVGLKAYSLQGVEITNNNTETSTPSSDPQEPVLYHLASQSTNLWEANANFAPYSGNPENIMVLNYPSVEANPLPTGTDTVPPNQGTATGPVLLQSTLPEETISFLPITPQPSSGNSDTVPSNQGGALGPVLPQPTETTLPITPQPSSGNSDTVPSNQGGALGPVLPQPTETTLPITPQPSSGSSDTVPSNQGGALGPVLPQPTETTLPITPQPGTRERLQQQLRQLEEALDNMLQEQAGIDTQISAAEKSVEYANSNLQVLVDSKPILPGFIQNQDNLIADVLNQLCDPAISADKQKQLTEQLEGLRRSKAEHEELLKNIDGMIGNARQDLEFAQSNLATLQATKGQLPGAIANQEQLIHQLQEILSRLA